MTQPKDLLKGLLLFLGNAPTSPSREELSEFLHEDVQWTFFADFGIINTGKGTSEVKDDGFKGIDACAAGLSMIFSKLYNPLRFKYQFHNFFGDQEFAAARYRVIAETAWGNKYENEYVLVARARDGHIAELWEYLDTLRADRQLNIAEK
ncbi:conserved hypothetical protein [delta proteobacterium NaphS2]|nr:conserved hypothetical protein [delta proteobacterium NaphS2]